MIFFEFRRMIPFFGCYDVFLTISDLFVFLTIFDFMLYYAQRSGEQGG